MKKLGIKIWIVLLVVLSAALGGLYFFFGSHYIPNTKLNYGFNEIEIGLMDYEEVSEIIYKDLEDYSYTLKLSTGEEKEVNLFDVSENISKEDIVSLLEAQRENKGIFEQVLNIDMPKEVVFSMSKVESVIQNLKSELDSKPIVSENAFITYNEETKEYYIVPEIVGNVLTEGVAEKLYVEFEGYNTNIDLVELGCFDMPEVYQTDSNLLSNLEKYKSYEGFNLNYYIGDNNEIIDISLLNTWLSPQYSESNPDLLNPDLPFVLDETSVKGYVDELYKKYTTCGMKRTFVTSTGETIEMTKGDYGWILSKSKMIEDINNHFNENKSEKKELIFSQRGICFGENDFSNSYVEVSIENQRVWMYVNGECIVDTPVVTGNISKGHNTRKGVFSLTYKTRNATLRGADYASFVYYWMPFDGGIGLHDATWRSSFGGTIYKTNGSHGCVNMPLDAAKTVYNNLESNMPIIVW